MAQPRWTSLDPLVVTGDDLEIGRGAWIPGQDTGSQLDNPKWMAVIYIDGHHVRGTVPQMPSAPADRIYPGEISWDARLSFPLAPWKDGREHTATVRVYAASFFKGWGDAPEDRWEWGTGSAADERPAVLETRFKLGVPAAEPTPPEPGPDDPYPWMPHLSNAKDDLELAVAAFYVKRGQSVDAQRVLFRQRFGMMQQLGQCTSEERARAHAALAPIFGWPV